MRQHRGVCLGVGFIAASVCIALCSVGNLGGQAVGPEHQPVVPLPKAPNPKPDDDVVPYRGDYVEGFMRQGKKHGRWRIYSDLGHTKVTATETWEDGEKSGEWCLFHDSGTLKQRSHYVHGKLHGWQQSWTSSATKIIEDYWIDGIQEGTYLQWSDEGLRTHDIPFRAGLVHGLRREWYSSGQRKRETEYDAGKRHGQHLEWHDNGRLAQQCKYDADTLVPGSIQKWDRDGKPVP